MSAELSTEMSAIAGGALSPNFAAATTVVHPRADVRAILAAELHQLALDLHAQGAALCAGSEDAVEHCLGLCERLGQVANMIEAPALQDVAMFLMANIPELMGQPEAAHAPPALCSDIERCLLEGIDSTYWNDLATSLCDARWPAALDSDAARDIAQGLKPLAAERIAEPLPRSHIARDALTLRPADDVGGATLQAFYYEAPQQAAKLSRILADYATQPAREHLQAAQRLTHTLKGSSALCGLTAIGHLAHALESRLQALAVTAPRAMPEVVFDAADRIEALVDCVVSGEVASSGTLSEVFALIQALQGEAGYEETVRYPALRVADAARCEDALEEARFDATQFTQTITETAALRVLETGTPQRAQVSESATEPMSEPAVAATPIESEPAPTLNVPVALIDENLRHAGELNISTGQLLAQLAQAAERSERLTQQLERVQAQVYELETLVDTRGVPSTRPTLQFNAQAGEFDPLELDEYTALHSLSRAFAETTLDSRELSRELSEELAKLHNALLQHARLGRELNDSVMNARLVSVATIVPRIERIVRQAARQLRREAVLEIQGRELQIDTDILNGLVEPLMHVLRNAIDHGLESPEERRALGKPPVGRVLVRFKREGNRIEVRVSDDGRGLDFAAIERRGRELNLIARTHSPTAAELSALIFQAGFSTRQEVSAISGRGVGMDVVRTSIERLKGRVHIESPAQQNQQSPTQQGCTVVFVLPLSLTAAHALFVGVGEAVYGIPSTSVEQVLYSDAGQVRELGAEYVFEYNDQVAPLHALATLLGQGGCVPADLASQPRPLVIVRGDTGLAALVVDRALDSRHIVIKGLSRMLPPLPGVAGACVLPNGGIGVVLEVRELLRRLQKVQHRIDLHSEAPLPSDRRRVLVVDDSLSARRTLAQLLGDSGYDVKLAVDGLDAIARMEASLPDVVLVDLEMPRMNGLEFVAHVRGQPAWAHVPVVMITSRATDKHRAQAVRAGVTEYFTKPYAEHELLDRIHALTAAKAQRA